MSSRSLKTRLKAWAAAWRTGRPSKQVRTILITGHDGAVGTAAFLAAVLRAAGEKVGILTSQFVEIAGERVQGSDQADTISDPGRLQNLLSQMRKAGCAYAIVEVPATLPEHCFEGVVVDMLIVRRCADNYTDHAALPAQTFRLNQLLSTKPQFIAYNHDDPAAGSVEWLRGRPGVISFGTHRRADCQITQVQMHPGGSQAALTIDRQTPLSLVTEQVGKQAIYNMAAAAAAAYVLHVPVAAIEQGCRDMPALASHMQFFPVARPYKLLVDAAVSPQGLAETLEAAKRFCKNRLIVVFGTPLSATLPVLPPTGEVLTRWADRIVLTDGEYHPKTSPKQLHEQLLRGVTAGGGEAKTDTVPDRAEAIAKAVSIARRGDVVLVAASSLHPYRQQGDERLAWSDHAVLRELFES